MSSEKNTSGCAVLPDEVVVTPEEVKKLPPGTTVNICTNDNGAMIVEPHMVVRSGKKKYLIRIDGDRAIMRTITQQKNKFFTIRRDAT